MRLDVDRLVLDGLPWQAADAALFRDALHAELARALDGRVPRADALAPAPIALPPGAPTDPASVARHVAGHLAGALTEVRG